MPHPGSLGGKETTLSQLRSLEVRGPGVSRAGSPYRLRGAVCPTPLPRLLVVARNPRHSLASGCPPAISAATFTRRSPLCGSRLHTAFVERFQPQDLTPARLRLIVADCTCKNAISTPRHSLSFQVGAYWEGDSIQPSLGRKIS